MTEYLVIGDRVAVDVTPPKTTVGGLIIPEGAKNEAQEGTIVAVGPDVKSPLITPGQRVIFGRFAGTVFVRHGEQIKVVREEDIMLIYPSHLEATDHEQRRLAS